MRQQTPAIARVGQLASAIALLLSGTTVATNANAQQSAQSITAARGGPEPGPHSRREITVTGSRIRRDDFSSAAADDRHGQRISPEPRHHQSRPGDGRSSAERQSQFAGRERGQQLLQRLDARELARPESVLRQPHADSRRLAPARADEPRRRRRPELHPHDHHRPRRDRDGRRVGVVRLGRHRRRAEHPARSRLRRHQGRGRLWRDRRRRRGSRHYGFAFGTGIGETGQLRPRHRGRGLGRHLQVLLGARLVRHEHRHDHEPSLADRWPGAQNIIMPGLREAWNSRNGIFWLPNIGGASRTRAPSCRVSTSTPRATASSTSIPASAATVFPSARDRRRR